MRRTHLATLVALAAVAAPVGIAASSASAAVTQSTSKYFLKGGTSPVKGVKVSGYDGQSVYVAVTAGTGSASVTQGSTALPFGYTSTSGSSIAFTGTQDAVNAALATLQVTVPDTATSVDVKVTAFANQDGLAYNPANQHFYKVVFGKITGTAAHDAAPKLTEMGLPGYMASITSADENDFISSKLQDPTTGLLAKNVWIGATDRDVEGDWKWAGGPDNGVQFWKGCSVADGGGPVNGGYSNWATGEPNNWVTGPCTNDTPSDPGEDCAVTNWAKSTKPTEVVGYWNDLPCRLDAAQGIPVAGYVAEFGNQPVGGSFTNVDIVTSSLTVAVPASKPTFLDTLFNLFGFNKKTLKKGAKVKVVKPKTKTQPAKVVTCPATFRKVRFSYTLLFSEAGRYSFYFTNAKGKRIPMECGTKIKSRVITEAISAPVIQSVKDGEKPSIVAYLKASAALTGDVDYPVLNVILKRKDGTLVRQDQPNPPLPGTPIR